MVGGTVQQSDEQLERVIAAMRRDPDIAAQVVAIVRAHLDEQREKEQREPKRHLTP